MNLFLENKKFKIVEKLKTERIKAQLNNKNVIYPVGKKEKVVIQIYHEEIKFFVLFGLSSLHLGVSRIPIIIFKKKIDQNKISNLNFYNKVIFDIFSISSMDKLFFLVNQKCFVEIENL